MNGDDDVIAMPAKASSMELSTTKDQVVQASAVGRVADVHARALAHRLQAFKNLDGVRAIGIGGTGLVGVDGGAAGFLFGHVGLF